MANRIEINHLHDITRGDLLHDLAAIYLLGRQPGTLITVVTEPRRDCFGELNVASGGADVALSPMGEVVREAWRRTSAVYPGVEACECVVMPDHFHGILWVKERLDRHMGHIVKAFKRVSEQECRSKGLLPKPDLAIAPGKTCAAIGNRFLLQHPMRRQVQVSWRIAPESLVAQQEELPVSLPAPAANHFPRKVPGVERLGTCDCGGRMNPRQNLIAALEGRRPERIPYTVNQEFVTDDPAWEAIFAAGLCPIPYVHTVREEMTEFERVVELITLQGQTGRRHLLPAAGRVASLGGGRAGAGRRTGWARAGLRNLRGPAAQLARGDPGGSLARSVVRSRQLGCCEGTQHFIAILYEEHYSSWG